MFKILRKIKKNQKGFTLVEVIVVAVIVAVLAAVAIPIYLNYIDTSRENQANNIAGSVASFCGACEADDGTCTAVSGTCSANSATVEIPTDYTVEDDAGDVTAFYTSDESNTTSKVYTYK